MSSWRRDGTNPSWRVRNAIRRGDPCGRPHRCGRPCHPSAAGRDNAARRLVPRRLAPAPTALGLRAAATTLRAVAAAQTPWPVLYDPASRCVRNAIRRGDPCGRPHRCGHPCHPSAAGRDKPVPYDPASRCVRNAIRRGDPCGRPHRCGRPCHPSAAGRDKPVPYDPAARRVRNAIRGATLVVARTVAAAGVIPRRRDGTSPSSTIRLPGASAMQSVGATLVVARTVVVTRVIPRRRDGTSPSPTIRLPGAPAMQSVGATLVVARTVVAARVIPRRRDGTSPSPTIRLPGAPAMQSVGATLVVARPLWPPVSSLGGGTGQARPLRSGFPVRPQCNP